MALRVSQMTAAAALSGDEILEVSQLSSTVTITATTISAQASDNSYNDSANGFVTAGFAAGDAIKVIGFTGNTVNNIYSAKVTAVTAGKLTIGGADGDVIVDDAAGESVTIKKWTTRRTTAAELAGAGTPTGPWKPVVRAKTTAALAANTYNNGTSGAGATLTGNANGALAAQDGVTLVVNDRLLVDAEATAANKGVYVVTQVGDAGTPYILTRATDCDSGGDLLGATVYISEGTLYADTVWRCTTNASITVGTTGLAFEELGGPPLEVIYLAVSDETTALTTGTAKITFRLGYKFNLEAVRGSLTTAQASGAIFTVDVNENGVSVLSTKLTIDNTEKTSTTAAAAPVISDASLADDSEITVDIDQIGDGTAKGLKVALIGRRAR